MRPIAAIGIALALLSAAAPARGQSCLNRTAFKAQWEVPSASFQSTFNSWTGAGFRPVQVTGYADASGASRYNMVFVKSPAGAPAFIHMAGVEAAQMLKDWADRPKQGYCLAWMNAHTAGGKELFTYLYEKKTCGSGQILLYGMNSASLSSSVNSYHSSGHTLQSISGYGGATAKFVAVWHKVAPPPLYALVGLSSADLALSTSKYAQLGHKLQYLNAYSIAGIDLYAAIWSKPASVNPNDVAHISRLSATNFKAHTDNMVGKGLRPTAIVAVVFKPPGLAPTAFFSATYTADSFKGNEIKWVDGNVTSFMKKWDVPGVSITLAYKSTLHLSSAWGLQDKEKNQLARYDSQWRLASVSKPVTSAAIYKLIEAGKLTLGSKVFGPGSIFGLTYSGPEAWTSTSAVMQRLKAITVGHLLEHVAGGAGWNNDGSDGTGDPMFQESGYTSAQLINWVLQGRTLSNFPGISYSYSNFGYHVLGRIVEKVTAASSYETWVKTNLFHPCFAGSFQIGGSTLAERKLEEVKYYPGDSPYGFNVRRMDSHGGWISSSLDLTRFGLCVDGISSYHKVLSAGSIANMTTSDFSVSRMNGYAKGWAVNSDSSEWSHAGSLPGTASLLMRRKTGPVVISVITNARGADGFFTDVYALARAVYNSFSVWPCSSLGWAYS